MWSKIKEYISAHAGTYSKPSTGIPKTDLASAVQTSLGKADTALQSYTETDPTVPSWAKQSSKPTYTASEVGALPDTTVIPTESTVSGWGFTKNAGTITGITMNGASKGTSGVVDLGTVLTSYTETDPIFAASAAHGITSSDISNWNSKTSNVGTITGINMNGASKGTSGVVDLGTVITAHQDISGKADKSEMSVVAGTGANADKTTITLKTGTSATVLTAHQDISGKADSATTLAGYGITDAYTKDESNSHFCSLDRELLAPPSL